MKCILSPSYSIILTLSMFEIVGGTINYTSLINDMYDKYMTRSIIIVPAENFLSFETISFIQKIAKDLSARKISSLILNGMQLRKGMGYHSKEFHRPLVVVFFDEFKAIHKFSKDVQHVDMTYSQHLVVFFGDSDEDHCKYCRDPMGNPFNLKFNSRMLVMCCESEYMGEWWSRRNNQTSTMPRGEWIGGLDKVNWYPVESVSTNRLSMDNRGLRIVIVQGSTFVWRGNNQLQGYMGEIIMELSRHMNFSISHTIEENVFGWRDLESLVWTGAIGKIEREEADVGVAEFSMTSERMDYIDFTVPLLSVKRALLIKKPDDVDIVWDACFKPFHGKVWMVIIFFLLISPLLLTVIKYRRMDDFFGMMSQHYLSVWGIFCQRPLPDSPYGASLRIMYISIYTMAVVLSAAYSASFISFLTTTSLHLPFHTWEEFAEDETYKLILQRGLSSEFTMFNDKLYEKLKAKMLPIDSFPLSTVKGLEQICTTQKVALYDIDTVYYSDLPCEIVSIPIGGVENFAMILPLRSEYRTAINHFLQKFKYNGMMTRLEDQYFKKKDSAYTNYKPVTFRAVSSILIVSAVGFFMAFVIFCIELPRIRH